MTVVHLLAALLLVSDLGVALLVAVERHPAAAASVSDHRASDVRVYDYDLGARAFQVRGFHANGADGWPSRETAPPEIAGRVYAPRRVTGRRLPLVVLAHGLWWTCSDRGAYRTYQKALAHVDSPNPRTQEHASEVLTRVAPRIAGWPCRSGTPVINSDHGYGYLARSLVRHGFVVISVAANGVNGGESGEVADKARGIVIYEHLRLWRALVEHDRGPLRGALTRAGGHQRAHADFSDAIDLHNVGLMGHSRGGRGAMWAAADVHRNLVPRGVRLRAVFGLAAAGPAFLDERARPYVVSRMPVGTWSGTCDQTGGDDYNRLAARRHNRANIALTVTGANHNNLNTYWAPGSGRMGATDDAYHLSRRPELCSATDPSADPSATFVHQLDGPVERRVAATYLTAFFARYQLHRLRHDALLSGRTHPLHGLAHVDVRSY